jgi:hypothetical protein
MGGNCSMHDKDEEILQHFSRKPEGRDQDEDYSEEMSVYKT